MTNQVPGWWATSAKVGSAPSVRPADPLPNRFKSLNVVFCGERVIFL